MIILKIPEEDFVRLKKESAKNPSSIVRKRCMVLLMKSRDPKQSCQKIANNLVCCRNFVMKTIHMYNKEGIDSILKIAPKSGRPRKCKDPLESADVTLKK